jgi:hypothetical protein
MIVLFSVAAASGQVFVVEFRFLCRFFFYHEALSTLAGKRIKAFGCRGSRRDGKIC